jgi:farnesyl-diphosphate farnesyltransferase
VATIAHTTPLRRALLRDLLERVSRLFYTTLIVVPASVRDQASLSYLFARAADTIADTDLIDRPQRLRFLQQLRGQFTEDQVCWEDVRAIQTVLVPCQTNLAERVLLEKLEDCFRLYLDFSLEDRARVRRLMTTLTNGMEMDLTGFPGDSSRQLTALKTMEDLDRYTYYVAGCVGEFWTDLMCGHLSSLSQWNVTDMARIGVRFGKGLQLTNILKDLSRDLQRGRCYVPEAMLREVDLAPTDLLKKDVLPAFRPVMKRLVAVAMEHLDQGWLYTMAIPRREVRLRLACMWPILSAGETLRLVLSSPDLLDPSVTLKISRGQVYRMIALTTLTGASGLVGTAYWGRLRKRVV